MKIIVGLGNPGKKYSLTRHNAGFILVDQLVNLLSRDVLYTVSNWEDKTKFSAQIATVRGKTEIVLLLVKPMTFMNNSGIAIQKIINYYKGQINTQVDLLVACDELDLSLGEFKLTRRKFSRSHNGIRSVNNHLHTLDYFKMRIGIETRTKETYISGENFVLQKFSKLELQILVEKVIIPGSSQIRELLQV